MIETFCELGIRDTLVEVLAQNNITIPTEIQVHGIPAMLEKKDLLAQAPTGSGKTLAYLLPLFETLDPMKAENQAIVLVPTHELAIQVIRVIESLAQNGEIALKATPIIGNVNIIRQIEKLKEKPQIIVGTPGRILELIQKKKIAAHKVKTLILDEGDRLLDDNNLEAVLAVLKTTLKERQVLLFSASISPKTIQRAKTFMKEAVILKSEDTLLVPDSIEHLYFVCEQRDKAELLRKIFRIVKPSKAIAFIHKSADIEVLTERLKFHGLNAQSIAGTNQKLDRKQILEDFRQGKMDLLIATDIAARGLDIEDISHIFNVELPETSENYLHRVGRTGRSGKKGVAISIATERELPLIKLYQKELKITLHLKDMFKGQLTDGKRSFRKR